MRIALLNLDCLATNAAIRSFIERERARIALVGLSPPFRKARGGAVTQGAQHLMHSGCAFSGFLACNFALPRMAYRMRSLLNGRGAAGPPSIQGLCARLGIPVVELENVNSQSFARQLADLAIDTIVSCYFDQILGPDIIGIPRLGAYNVHTSVLPRHRGPMPVIHGWTSMPPSLGVSLHRVDAGVDTGPVLIQEVHAADPHETVIRTMAWLHTRGLAQLSDNLASLPGMSSFPQNAADASYEGFPSRKTMGTLRRRHVRLFDRADLLRALRTPIGF